MRACGRLQGNASHAGDFGQVLLQLVEHLDSTLHGTIRL
jgi:hypothetical protein